MLDALAGPVDAADDANLQKKLQEKRHLYQKIVFILKKPALEVKQNVLCLSTFSGTQQETAPDGAVSQQYFYSGM